VDRHTTGCYNTVACVNPWAHIHPVPMPGRGTPLACIRVPEADWAAFKAAATGAGTDRSALIRAFIAWYLKQPGAKLPTRP